MSNASDMAFPRIRGEWPKIPFHRSHCFERAETETTYSAHVFGTKFAINSSILKSQSAGSRASQPSGRDRGLSFIVLDMVAIAPAGSSRIILSRVHKVRRMAKYTFVRCLVELRTSGRALKAPSVNCSVTAAAP